MPTLLKIDSSPRGEHSVSRQLGKHFAADWQKTHTDGKVVTRDLMTTSLPFVDMPWIAGAYSDPATRTSEQKAALTIGDELIAELKAADHWLITAPMYNFAIPATLKAYIDHIVRVGVTFNVNADGSYTGLITGKKATVIMASAGEYKPGAPAASYDSESTYLKLILGFIGVTDVTVLYAGATWKVDKGMTPLDTFVGEHATEIANAAK